MAYVKITRIAETFKDLFEEWVREAVRLNESKGDPTKEHAAKSK